MITFKEFMKLKEDLWWSKGPYNEPGTKRVNPTNWLNKQYGKKAGMPTVPLNSPTPTQMPLGK